MTLRVAENHAPARGEPTSRVDSSRPTVLVLAKAFPPEPVSGAARPARFVKYLPEFGYDTVVIAGQTECAGANVPSVLRVPSRTPSGRALRAGQFARWIERWLLPYNESLPWAAHAAVEAESVFSGQPISAVLSSFPPLGTHLVGLWLKRRYSVPWIADFRDPFVGNPGRDRRWIASYDRVLERQIARSADAILVNTQQVADQWRSRYRHLRDKITVLWNGFDPDEVRPVAERRGSGPTVIAHVGSLYRNRHPGALMASLVRVVNSGAVDPGDVCLRLIGPIDDQCLHRNKEAVAQLRSWGCLEYDGRSVPVSDARAAVAEADYLLLLDSLGDDGSSSQVPAKLFDYVLSERPILAFTQRDTPTDWILRNSGVVFSTVYHGDSEEAIDRVVVQLLKSQPTRSRHNEWFEHHFNGRNQVRALADVISSLGKR